VVIDQSSFDRAVDCFCEPIEFNIDSNIQDVRDIATVRHDG
jgi:hypothetical protein